MLATADGVGTVEIMRRARVSKTPVWRWQARFMDEGVEGFVTITGGKATTLRGMAEATADVVCGKLGLDMPCRTHEEVLLPYAAYYS